MAKTDWKHIEKLNGGPVYFAGPSLDTKDEVWFYATTKSFVGYEFRVWSLGTLSRDEPKTLPKGPTTARRTLYWVLKQLFVDLEWRGAAVVLRRGLLNGAFVTTVIPPDSVDAVVARYSALGFTEGSPWNATPALVTRRDYGKAKREAKHSLWVDGSVLEAGGRKLTRAQKASREAAIGAAEQLIAKLEKGGARLTNLELVRAEEKNPAPPRAKGAAKKSAKPAKAKIATPKDAYEAVDAAMAILADLDSRLPKGHAVLERLDPKRDAARLADMDCDGSFFLRMHKAHFGAWEKRAGAKPDRKRSSWDYFAARYGSATWIVDSSLDVDLPGFLVGEVSGGGYSHFAIDARGTYDAAGLAKAMRLPEIASLFVFHEGAHHGYAFAFDRRVKDAKGEHPIVSFDEGSLELPADPAKTKIVPFGFWLYDRVRKVAKVIERALGPVN